LFSRLYVFVLIPQLTKAYALFKTINQRGIQLKIFSDTEQVVTDYKMIGN